ncbi:MAG: glutamate racemase [Alkalispirochaeta sp.]
MILFYDSGIGGLSYLEESLRRNPDLPVCYLADTAFFPYGERSPGEVRARVVSVVRSILEEFPIDAIVIACNTASVVALSSVRSVVDVPVVGVVPAVKPAAQLTRSNHIAILSTNRTARDPYTDGLVREFAGVAEVIRIGVPRLVAAAETHICDANSADVRRIVHEDIAPHLDPRVDTVVLACTHFVRYRNEISTVLGSTRRIVDSLDGVVRRVHDIVKTEHLTLRGNPQDPPLFLTTGSETGRFSCLPMTVRSVQVPRSAASMDEIRVEQVPAGEVPTEGGG